MSKFKVLCCILSAVIMQMLLSCCAFADGPDPVLHVYISNVEEVLGGNSKVKYNQVDFRSKMQKKEYWADYKFKVNQEDSSRNGLIYWGSMIEPKGTGAKKPFAGKLPTEKNGLLNPKAPINITSYTDKLFISFSKEYYTSGYSVRIIDDKGKIAASIKNENDNAEIALTSKARNYYAELCVNGKKYFYILLKMKATDTTPAPSSELAANEETTRTQAEEIEAVKRDYMRKKGIRNENALTEKDWENISAAMTSKQLTEEDDEGYSGIDTMPKELREVFEAYMKKHNIKSLNDFTQDDYQAVMNEIQAKGIGQSNSAPKKKRR